MELGSLLWWLSVIHCNQLSEILLFPDVPTLGQLLKHSNTFEWNSACYNEVSLLGRVSSLPYEEYLALIASPFTIPGSSAMNPIIIGDEEDTNSEKSVTRNTLSSSFRSSKGSVGSNRSRGKFQPPSEFTDSSESEDNQGFRFQWLNGHALSRENSTLFG